MLVPSQSACYRMQTPKHGIWKYWQYPITTVNIIYIVADYYQAMVRKSKAKCESSINKQFLYTVYRNVGLSGLIGRWSEALEFGSVNYVESIGSKLKTRLFRLTNPLHGFWYLLDYDLAFQWIDFFIAISLKATID